MRQKIAVKVKYSEPTTVSILLVSVAIFLTMILVTYMGVMFTESSKKVDSTCRDKILGYEQS